MAIHNVDYKCKCHKYDWKELRCKRCRYKHCLAKGMKKELVLSVRLHDFRKKRSLEMMQNSQTQKESSLTINELTCNEPTVIQIELEQMLKVESFVRRIRHSSTMIPMEYFDDYNCLEDLLNSGHNILTKSEAFSLKLPKRWDRDSHLNIIMEYGLWSDKDKLQSEGLNQFFKDLFVSISFVKTLPLFNILTIEEQSILITKTMLQLYLMLQLYYSFEINATTLSFPSGEMPYEIMKTTSIKCNCELLERYARKKYIMPMKKFSLVRPDISEFVLLMVLLVANPAVSDELSPKAKEIIRTEQERYGKILLQLEQNRHGQGPGALRYSQCLELMWEVIHSTKNSVNMIILINLLQDNGINCIWPNALLSKNVKF